VKGSVFHRPRPTVWVVENVPDHANGYVMGVFRTPELAMRAFPSEDWHYETRYGCAPHWWSTTWEAQIEEHEVS